MKQKWLILFLLLGAGLALFAGCTTRTTTTPQAGEPIGPPVPTLPVVPTALPAAETKVPGPTAVEPDVPIALVSPELTLKGTMASGIPWGTTGDGQYFKGDPNAPLLMFEFSDYQ